jgi:hypothetical protein
MDSISKLLKDRKPDEPKQVDALKLYIKAHYDIESAVKILNENYLISVPSAAVAQKLRFETATITKECNLDKRLIIHISYP